MFDYITYSSYKTTTIQPSNCTYTSQRFSNSGNKTESWSQRANGAGVVLNTDVDPPETSLRPFDNVRAKTFIEGSTHRKTECHGSYSEVSYYGYEINYGGNAWHSTENTEGGNYGVSITWERSTSQNSWTVSETRQGGRSSDNWSSSTSEKYPEMTVSNVTTTTENSEAIVKITSQGTGMAISYFTTMPSSNTSETVLTYEWNTVPQIVEATENQTIEKTITTTHNTSSFVTYTEWSRHVIVVADTIIVTAVPQIQGGGGGRIGNLAVAQLTPGTETTGIHGLQYCSAGATISWLPPLTISTQPTGSPFTTTSGSEVTHEQVTGNDTWRYTWTPYLETTTGATSETSSSTQTTTTETTFSEDWVTGSMESGSCEDWVTYTITNSSTSASGSNTITVTYTTSTFALETGETEYDDEGNTITNGPQTTAFISQPTTRSVYTTSSTNTTVNFDVWQDSFSTTSKAPVFLMSYAGGVSITEPKLTLLTRTLGVHIVTSVVPWRVEGAWYARDASALLADTSINSIQSITSRKTVVYTTVNTRKYGANLAGSYSSSYREGENYGNWNQTFFNTTTERSASSFTSSGTVFSTTENNLTSYSLPVYYNQAYATFGYQEFAAAGDWGYRSSPTRTSAAMIFTLEGNDHTLHQVEEMFSANVFPNEIEPIIYPSFSMVLDRNDCGFGAHPSAWSTITISRKGNNISSFWRYWSSWNELNPSAATASATCRVVTTSAFPFGVNELNTSLVGGNMQPNKNVFLFKAPGVYFTYTGTNSGFETVASYTSTTMQAAGVTIRKPIDVIAGVGLHVFDLPDNGL